MSSAYDSSLFQRAGSCFTLSQRFIHNWNKFYGSIRIGIQMLFTNYLIHSLPRPLAYALLFIYFVMVSTLFFLIVQQLCNKKNGRYDDLDLADILPRHKNVKRIGLKQLLQIVLFVLNFIVLFATWNENLGGDYLKLYLVFLIYSSTFYTLYAFLRCKQRAEC